VNTAPGELNFLQERFNNFPNFISQLFVTTVVNEDSAERDDLGHAELPEVNEDDVGVVVDFVNLDPVHVSRHKRGKEYDENGYCVGRKISQQLLALQRL
jgi:hypothetical protein